MSQIDDLILLLMDYEWHNLTEIAHKLKITSQKLEKIVELLKEFNFIQCEKSMLRISTDVKELIEALEKNEKVTKLTQQFSYSAL